jgi:hypothetical protein
MHARSSSALLGQTKAAESGVLSPDLERFMTKRAQSQVTRGGSIDQKSGYGSEVGYRFPMSAFGTKRTSSCRPAMSAFGGKADIDGR